MQIERMILTHPFVTLISVPIAAVVATVVTVVMIVAPLAYAQAPVAKRAIDTKPQQEILSNRAAVSNPNARVMAVDRCLGDPKFLERLGMSKRALVDTTQTQPVGLSVVDVDTKGQLGRRVQHESWSKAGYLGAVQRDTEGNIFVYAAPSFTLEKNPVEKSNVLYKVDNFSGEMTPYVEIEKGAPSSPQNPYGIVSTTFDCVTKNLYVASVFGSTPGGVNGTISVVDTKASKETKEPKEEPKARVAIRSFDAFALVAAQFPGGRRLLYASAREPVVLSRAIKDDGSLADDERVEVQLDDWAQLGDRRARRLRIDPQGQLLVRVQPFDFALSASSVIARAEMVFEFDTKESRFKMKTATETPTQTHALPAAQPAQPATPQK
jgi:hypothetical protein